MDPPLEFGLSPDLFKMRASVAKVGAMGHVRSLLLGVISTSRYLRMGLAYKWKKKCVV